MGGPELAAIIVATIAAAGTVTASFLAYRAKENTKPLANGWGKDIVHRLERIEKKGDQTHSLVLEHLSDHAGNDVTHRNGRR